MSTPASTCIQSMYLFTLIILTATAGGARAAVESCPQFVCGPVNPTVRFPFQLVDNQISHRCAAYPGFNVTCTHDGRLYLKLPELPDAANLTVAGIDYTSQEIAMWDDHDCLANQLVLGLNLSGTPFRIVEEKTFVFFTCPSDNITTKGFRTVACMSSENFTVIALPATASATVPKTCQEMKRVPVPGAWVDSNSFDFNVNLLLEWDLPDCRRCEARGGVCGFKGDTGLDVGCFNLPPHRLSSTAKYGIGFGLGILGMICVIGLLCYWSCRQLFDAKAYDRPSHTTGAP